MGFKLKRASPPPRTIADEFNRITESFKIESLVKMGVGLADHLQPTLDSIDDLVERLRLMRRLLVKTAELVEQQRRTGEDPVVGNVDDISIKLHLEA